MRCFWSDAQRAHAPAQEFFNGALHPAADVPGRAEAILAAIGSTEEPEDRGMTPILAVHSPDYVDFLRNVHDEWRAAGRAGDAFPYCFPTIGRRTIAFDRVDARLGLHSIDTATPVGPGTWAATYAAAQVALGALDAVLGGERAAFALTRPPGHHAGADYCGGYSYLNHAAITAEAARGAGHERVAIIDVDYHHGNGTQDIFLDRGDVAYASIHADPRTDYPFFWGHADEGNDATLNLPLPRGTEWDGYARALDRALQWIGDSGAGLLVVSFGADTFEGDPISHFRLRTADYRPMGRAIAGLGLPTVIVMEGGYAVDALGANVCEFLGGF